MEDKKMQQMIEFATYGLHIGQKADLKIKSAETINRKIDDVQREIQKLIRIPSLNNLSPADLLLAIQNADLSEQQQNRLHQLMWMHHELAAQLNQITEEIRKFADFTKTISFMIDIMNAI